MKADQAIEGQSDAYLADDVLWSGNVGLASRTRVVLVALYLMQVENSHCRLLASQLLIYF